MISEWTFDTPESAESFLRDQGYRPIRAANWLHAGGQRTASVMDGGIRVVEIRKGK